MRARKLLGYGLVILAGLALGVGGAVLQIRQGLSSGGIANGPWRTSENIGTKDASLVTRAVVALRGLLALPDSEAVYFNASIDSAGDALDGNCDYVLSGGTIPARWWSITAYASDGFLIPNRTGYYSVGSAAFSEAEQADWKIAVGANNKKTPQLNWIPIGKAERFELTLRAYHASPEMLANRAQTVLPEIKKAGCAS